MLAPACRRLQPELMDQPDLDIREHRHALAALGRGNAVSRSVATLWPAIARAASVAARPIRILDLACGGGHVVVGLARRAARTGVPAEVCGCDISPVAIEYARALSGQSGVRHVQFTQLDAAGGLLPTGFDVVLCSLFLHHLEDDEAERVLRRMKDAARALMLVSDLRRTHLGYSFAWVGCRLLSRSRVFHVDGTRSVEAAFTTKEAQAMAARAGLAGARVTERWPQRWLLTWYRSDV